MDKFKQQIDIIHKLRFGNTTKESLIGGVTCLVLSKNLFKLNAEVYKFIFNIFNIKFLPYAIRSRTLMLAKTCRIMVNLDSQEVKAASIRIYEYIMTELLPEQVDMNEDITIYPEMVNKKKIKNGNALKNMNIWLKNNSNKK